MVQATVAVVLDAHRAFGDGDGDMEAACQDTVEDVLLQDPGRGPLSGEIERKSAARARCQRQTDLFRFCATLFARAGS